MSTEGGGALESRVFEAVRRHLDWAKTNGRVPSVLAVARDVALSNTTLRRNYPEAVSLINEARQHATMRSTPTSSGGAPAYDDLIRRNARLRRENQDLRNQVLVARAVVQRLAHSNADLEARLLEVSSVPRIDQLRRARAGDPPSREGQD